MRSAFQRNWNPSRQEVLAESQRTFPIATSSKGGHLGVRWKSGRAHIMTRFGETACRLLAAGVASRLVGWSCAPETRPERDAGGDAAGPDEARPDAAPNDAAHDAIDAAGPEAAPTDATDEPTEGPSPDAAPTDAADEAGDSADTSPPDATDLDGTALDAACSLEAQNLTVTGNLSPTSIGVVAMCHGAMGTTVSGNPGFLIRNVGTLPVSWTARVSSAYLSLDNLGSTLAAGAFVTVTISSRALPAYPPSRTIQDAVVVTEDNPSVCPYMLPISELFEGYFFTPPTLAFGDVVVGRTSQLHVTASFSGPDFAGVAAAGPASDFEGMATTSNGGGPNPIAGFDVTFSPSVIG